MLGRVEEAYRAQRAAIIPEAGNLAAYDQERACAVVAWLINRLHLRLARSLKSDEAFRVGTLRGRVLLHLTAAIDATQTARILPQTNAVLRQRRHELVRCWPESTELAMFPAFE